MQCMVCVPSSLPHDSRLVNGWMTRHLGFQEPVAAPIIMLQCSPEHAQMRIRVDHVVVLM